MRPFNEREKDIIRQITNLNCDVNSDYVYKLINSILIKNFKDCGLVIDFNNNQVFFMYPETFEFKATSYINNIYEFFALIIYLENNRYITIFKVPVVPDFDFNDYYTYGEILVDSKYSRNAIDESIDPYYCGNDEPTGKTKHGKIKLKSYNFGIKPYTLLTHLFQSDMYVSEELKHLEKNNFKTIEEIRFNKQQCLTRIGLFLAFLGTLAAFLVPFFTSK